MEENEQSRPEAESPITAHSLLMQEQHLQKAKQTQVVKLLEERDSRQKGHDQRMAEISADLKALGYTYPRKPRGAKSATESNGTALLPEESFEGSQDHATTSKKKKK